MLPLFAQETGKVLSVGELTREIKRLLEDGFPSVQVAGEISNLKRPPSGHVYLSLKDKDAQLCAVVWKSTMPRVPFQLHDGLEVVAHGRITVYAPRGDYQLVIDEIHPK